jgi:SRSO17 transposase
VRPPRQGLLLVRDNQPVAVAAVGSVVDPQAWDAELESLVAVIAGRFARPEAAGNAADLVAGLMSDLERKNCWTIAEHAGHQSPDRLQHLLSRAVWDADAVRDDLRGYVAGRLLAPGEQGVLVVDETGDLKKGDHTVGVQRQYTGTAGRVENAQVAVYLTLAGTRGHTFIDRALYLPKSWDEDPRRRRDAGVPDHVTFATKPALAADMITRAVTGGVTAGWVTGDEVYGACPTLRAAIRHQQIGYVLAVASNHRATQVGAGEPDTAADIALTTHNWQRLAAGTGSKGLRYYSWTRAAIEPEPASGGHHWILIRRNDTTGEIAYYRCWHPNPVTLAELVAVAGKRWRIEENFQTAKGHVGLDQHQVRTWSSWHRWVTLSMAAHALLTIVAANTRDTDTTHTSGLIPITLAEIRRLIQATRQRLQPLTHTLTWSHWRRRHQHRAQQAHYRHRGHPPPQPDLRL